MPSAGRILVVDDDDTIRELISIALGDEGYEVMTAIHGREALERTVSWSPDVILLDMRMPVMDGWEFTRPGAARPYRRADGRPRRQLFRTPARCGCCLGQAFRAKQSPRPGLAAGLRPPTELTAIATVQSGAETPGFSASKPDLLPVKCLPGGKTGFLATLLNSYRLSGV